MPGAFRSFCNIATSRMPAPDILDGFTVDNLLNEQYSRYLDYLPSPGVSVKGSLKIRFGAT